MAFGRKDDEDSEEEIAGDQYAVELALGTKGGTRKILNNRWRDGWKFVAVAPSGSVTMLIFERR